MSSLVQISRQQLRVDRVPRGVEPLLELNLEDNQRVVGIEARSSHYERVERKTIDWHFTVYVETRL